MSIELTFFCGLDRIIFPKTSHNGDRFAEKYYITNDKIKIRSLVSDKSDALGFVESDYILNRCDALVNYKIYLNEDFTSFVNERIEAHVIGDLAMIQGFLERLWVIKDHSVSQDRAWLFVKDNNHNMTVHNNNWNVRHSTAGGKTVSMDFTHDEIKLARILAPTKAIHLHETKDATSLIKSSLRFQRFLYFIQIARSSPDVAMKIAQYCSALEALVSSSSTELSHQVAERVACLLEPLGERRLERFRKIKEAYGYRSRAVHGAVFDIKSFTKIVESSEYIDGVCRKLATMYIENISNFSENIESKQEKFDSYFQDVIFVGSECRSALPIDQRDIES